MQVSLNFYPHRSKINNIGNQYPISNVNRSSQLKCDTFSFKNVSFAGATPEPLPQAVVYAPECADIIQKGGVGTVAQDFAQGKVFPKDKIETLFFMPYYNGKVIYEKDVDENIKHPEKGPHYKFNRTEVLRKDGKPIFTKVDWRGEGRTIDSLKQNEYSELEEVARKKISTAAGDETAVLYRMIDKNKKNRYLVFTQATGAMRVPYENGTGYSSGSAILTKPDPYAINSKATYELLQEAKIKPAHVLLNDPQTAYFIDFAQQGFERNNDYFADTSSGFIAHNPGSAYQQKMSNKAMVTNLLDRNDLKTIEASRIYKAIQGDEDLEQRFFRHFIPDIIGTDDKTSALMLAIKHRENDSLGYMGTVSPGAATSYAIGNGDAPGAKEALAKLYKEGKFTGILNGLDSPAIDPKKPITLDYYADLEQIKEYAAKTDKNFAGEIKKREQFLAGMREKKGNTPEYKEFEEFLAKFKPFELYNPDELTMEEVNKVKQRNALNLFERINASEKHPEYTIGVVRKGTKVMGKISPDIINKMKDAKNPYNVHLIVSWGRGDEQKGLDLTIEAFKKFVYAHPKEAENAVLVLGGDIKGSPHLSDYMYSVINSALKDPKLEGRFVFLDGFAPNAVLGNAATQPIFPSRFAPCELTDHECRPYASVPTVTDIEGLADKNFDIRRLAEQKIATGFKTQHSALTQIDKLEDVDKMPEGLIKTINDILKDEKDISAETKSKVDVILKKDASYKEVKQELLALLTNEKGLSIEAKAKIDAQLLSVSTLSEEGRVAIREYNDYVAEFKQKIKNTLSSMFIEDNNELIKLSSEEIEKKIEREVAEELKPGGELAKKLMKVRDVLVSDDLAECMFAHTKLSDDTKHFLMKNNVNMEIKWATNSQLQSLFDRKHSASELYIKHCFNAPKIKKGKSLVRFSEEILRQAETDLINYFTDGMKDNIANPKTKNDFNEFIERMLKVVDEDAIKPNLTPTPSFWKKYFTKQTAVAFASVAALGTLGYYLFKADKPKAISNKTKQIKA